MEKEKLDMISRKVADCHKRAYGEKLKGVFLYGSYAKGDYDEESDIDFVAIVDEERQAMRKKLWQIRDEAARYEKIRAAATKPDWDALGAAIG